MSTRHDATIRLEQKVRKIGQYAALKCGVMEVGWESSEFHAFNSLNPTLRGILCANFIDYRLGDCGIWALLMAMSPKHYEVVFDSAAMWYSIVDCPAQANAAAELKSYLRKNRIVVERRMAALLKRVDQASPGIIDYDTIDLETEKECELLQWNNQTVRAQLDYLDRVIDDLLNH